MKQKLYEDDKRVMLPVQTSVRNKLRELLPDMKSDNERVKKAITYITKEDIIK